MWRGVFFKTLLELNLRCKNGRSLYTMLKQPEPEDCLLELGRGIERVAPILFLMPGELDERTLSMVVGKHKVLGETFGLGVVLFGQAAEYVGPVVHTLSLAANRGFGTNDSAGRRGNAALRAVRFVNSQSELCDVPSGEDELDFSTMRAEVMKVLPLPFSPIALEFVEPLQLEGSKKSGRRILQPQDLTAARLAETLLRRVSNLSACHSGVALDLDGLNPMLQGLHFTHTDLNLCKQEQFSANRTRQAKNDRDNLSGIIGTVHIELNHHQWLWPYFQLAPFLGLGKRASYGQGAMRVG